MYSPLQAASWGFLLLIANLSRCEDSLLHTLSGSFPELIGAATGGFYLSFLLLIPVSWLIYNKICPFDGYGGAYHLSQHWRDLGGRVESLRSICATQRDLDSRNQGKKQRQTMIPAPLFSVILGKPCLWLLCPADFGHHLVISGKPEPHFF